MQEFADTRGNAEGACGELLYAFKKAKRGPLACTLMLHCLKGMGLHRCCTAAAGDLSTVVIGVAREYMRHPSEWTRVADTFTSEDMQTVLEMGVCVEARIALMNMCAHMWCDRNIRAEAHRWKRLRAALVPYIIRMKEIACRSLDKPGVGARFLRDHADALRSCEYGHDEGGE